MSCFGQEWARVIRDGTSDEQVVQIIQVLNALTHQRKARCGALIVACSQVLAQVITQAPLDVAPEIRAGILSLIDGYAMQSATQESGR